MKKLPLLFLFPIILLFFLLSSCDINDWLEITPKGMNVPTTVEDFKLVMNKPFVSSYDVDLFMSDDIKVCKAKYFDDNSKSFYYRAATWEKDFVSSFSDDDYSWDALYHQILTCNAVLAGLKDPSTKGEEKEKIALIAQAKFHRAFAHFSAVNLYAKQYDPHSAATDLGVPIRTSPKLYDDLTRQSVQAVYDQVLQDLTEAIHSGAMSKQPDKILKVIPSMAAAYGLLARVYLQMGNYSKALEAADNSLSIYSTLVDYTSLDSPLVAYKNPEVLLLYRFGYNRGYPDPFFVNEDLLTKYDSNDMRLSLLYRTRHKKRKKHKNPPVFLDFYFTDLPYYVGLSTAEMFLIRAECNAREGQLNAVANDLNTLRSKRILSYKTLAAFTNRSKALAYVKGERRRELAHQGLRLFDLKRYNLLDHDNISITHIVDDKMHTLPPNSSRWIAPIAMKIIELNPKIKQNPR